jgi:hypothetical protein
MAIAGEGSARKADAIAQERQLHALTAAVRDPGDGDRPRLGDPLIRQHA